MSNKNISQFSLLTDAATGDFLLLYDVSSNTTLKVYVNDIASIVPSVLNPNNHFKDILVDRYAWISGIIGGQTGTHILSGQYGAILGGVSNVVSGRQCIVCGGNGNTAKGFAAMVGAGATNQVTGDWSFIGAGRSNLVDGVTSVIAAGNTNTVNSINSFIGAGGTNVIFKDPAGVGDNAIVAGRSNNIIADFSSIVGGDGNILTGGWDCIGGGASNIVTGQYIFLGGGKLNIGSGDYSFIGGGNANVTRSSYAVIGGGNANTNLGGTLSVIGGGDTNTIGFAANDSCILGGVANSAFGGTASICGGDTSRASGNYTFIGGGLNNNASGNYSTVPGGTKNSARGHYSFAAGRNSVANEDGSWVISDAKGADKVSAGQNTFLANFSGGCWITGGGLNARQGFNIYPTGDTPTASTPGRSGDFAYKDNYLYVFTGDQTDLSNKNWGRIPLSTLNSTPPSVVSNTSNIVHCRGDGSYDLTTTFGAVTFGGANIINPILSVPAGNGTFMFDCVFGAERGSTAAIVEYYLYNTSDSVMIPNTSGRHDLSSVILNGGGVSVPIRTITGTNYATAKNFQLYARKEIADNGGVNALIKVTGTYLSYVQLG